MKGKKKRLGHFAAARRRRNAGWVVAGLSVAALVVVVAGVTQQDRAHTHHPMARAPEAQSRVVPSAQFAQYPRVAQTYVIAAAIPSVLDGLYCYCNCSEHSGHYSLLDCFASEHAARCDVCMSEAVIGYQMSQDGASMDEIRAEVDRTYGT